MSLVPSAIENQFVKPGESVVQRWEGTCTEGKHNKWWAAVFGKDNRSRSAHNVTGHYFCRSANGSLNSPGAGRVHNLSTVASKTAAQRKFNEKVNEKRNLSGTRPYSYTGEMVVIEQGPIDPSNPPTPPKKKNPKIKGNVFADILGG